MRSSPLTKSSTDSAARAADVGQARIARERAREQRNAAYVGDPTPIPPGKRRVLLDLAPDTLGLLLESLRQAHYPIHGFQRDDVTRTERLLVEALEKAR